MHYVSKRVFDEVYAELQTYKNGAPKHLAIVSFEEVYNVGILHDRIKQLEAEVSQPNYTYSAFFTENEQAMATRIKSLEKQLEEWKHGANYWAIESDTNHSRWEQAMADAERYRNAGKALLAYGDMLSAKTANLACAKHYQTELANWSSAATEAKKSL